MKLFNFVPNFLTLTNLFFGCIAVVFGVMGDLEKLALFVSLGLICDFFDGFFARLLNIESALGVQLDSLADMVTSGFVPGVVMYQLFVISGAKSVDFSYQYENFTLVFTLVPLALVGFLIPLGAAFRLARFNLITEKVSFFRGVPTPAIALFIVALPLFIQHPLLLSIKGFILTPIALSIIIVLSVFFMNIHWKMIALKGFNRSNPWGIIFPVILLLISIVLFYILGLAALIIIIITYIVLSLLKNVFGV